MEKHIIDIVEDLNLEIMENFPEELEYPPLSFCTNGSIEIVEFYGYQLWNPNDQKDRRYDKKTDAYEPIESFLRRRVNRFVEQISKIKLKEE